ncbi:MAG: sucrose synthase [Cyanophyceae cyanobacterium]
MSALIDAVLKGDERTALRQFVSQLRGQDKRYLLRNDILSEFEQFCAVGDPAGCDLKGSPLGRLVLFTQEIILEGGTSGASCWVLRPQIAKQEAVRLFEDMTAEDLTVPELLDLRDRFVGHFHPQEGDVFEIDFQPFYDYSPVIRDAKNIGKGVQFLNRYLSSNLFQAPNQWLETLYSFLQLHSYNGAKLMLNERVRGAQDLSDRVKRALDLLAQRPADQPYGDLRFDLQDLGFEPGWGNTAGRVRATLEMLDTLLDSPDDRALESFLSRVPMVFRIVLVSVHGWFAQEEVLGRPDTGGQVVYVLDQARSLAIQLQQEVRLAGLETLNVHPKVVVLSRLIPQADGTTCDRRLEKIHGTENAWILRVPLRDFNSKVTQHWISRFEIWPYLETYAIDAEKELLAEFQGLPDLIVGNYTDGNLVAFLLARRLKVTQCNIAHALEKSKYLFSNLYWQDLEPQYHFSLQFTADLIAMNAANFIVSSTYQEIVGTSDSVGQYESYGCFTMPDLYHVVSGIELFSPKFNVVPPGVNETFYFPYSRTEERSKRDRDRLDALLFTDEDPAHIYGTLDDPTKRPLFSMARLDRIKNITGLAECFGQSPELQARYNLILVAGKLRTEESSDREEIDEIERLYRAIDTYDLHGKIRWLGVRLPKGDSAEVYRIIADHQGVFVQPALFEAFGLTILEAMISGLPTFGTRFGGPLEIIQDGENGFYINPTNGEEMVAKLVAFHDRCLAEPDYWQRIAEAGIERVYSTYTWNIHTSKLLSLAKIYGFWNYASREKREDLLRYLESLFYLIYRPRAQAILADHANR